MNLNTALCVWSSVFLYKPNTEVSFPSEQISFSLKCTNTESGRVAIVCAHVRGGGISQVSQAIERVSSLTRKGECIWNNNKAFQPEPNFVWTGENVCGGGVDVFSAFVFVFWSRHVFFPCRWSCLIRIWIIRIHHGEFEVLWKSLEDFLCVYLSA